MDEYTENNGSQFNLDCTNFTVEDFKSLNRLRNITAFVCAAVTLAILIFLICRKAFTSLFKRLYLYLVVGTLFAEIALTLNIEHQWHYEGQETVCVWLGFFTQWTGVMVFILSYEIVLHLFCLVVSQIRGSLFPRCTGSKCCTVTVELIYIALPLIISTTFAVLPYIRKSYGVAGPWCWVQSLNESCDPVGFVTQVAFFGVYMAVCVVGIAASLVFSVIYFKIATSCRNARILLNQTFYVMIFQIIHILIIICNLSLRVYTLLSRRQQLYGLWCVHAFTTPFRLLVFPLGYFMCFYPIKSIVLTVFKRIVDKCNCYKRKPSSTRQVEVQSVTKHATAPRSDRTSQPSDTYFVIPHPDELTEKTPLISDTGYDSNNTFQNSQYR